MRVRIRAAPMRALLPTRVWGDAHGGAKSWIDDVSMHSNSFEGFADLFQMVLTRLSYAGMSLKASKCFLLHQKLEVLGYCTSQ